MTSKNEGTWRRPPLETGRLMDAAIRLGWTSLTTMWPVWLFILATNGACAWWLRGAVGPDMALTVEETLIYATVFDVVWNAVLCGLAAAAYRTRMMGSERLAEVFA